MLVLMRHAKSCWNDPSLSDHQRPLAPRGKRALPLVSAQLQRWQLTPTHIYCSDAVRCQQSAEHLCDLFTAKLTLMPELYHATPQEWRQWLDRYQVDSEAVATKDQPAPSQPCHLWIGHNPAMRIVVTEHSKQTLTKFPTAALYWPQQQRLWTPKVGEIWL